MHQTQIIDYPPEKLRSFFRNSYEWIDNLDFSLDPLGYMEKTEAYLQVKQKEDGKIGKYTI